METRNITITLEKAREWYNSDNESLKELSLQAFGRDELAYNFKKITTFKKACEALNLNNDDINCAIKDMALIKISPAMFKLNIIRRALNLGYDLSLTKNPKGSILYYPYNPLVIESSTHYKGELNSSKMHVIGKIKSEGVLYNVLGGGANGGGLAGFSDFNFRIGVGNAYASFGFLGCATEDIAKHFGKYFGMLITEAKYADIIVDFKIIEDKYGKK